MGTESRSGAQRFFSRWVLATFGGWLLGVVVILLLADIGEIAGIGQQFSVGIGMGWSIGYAQWRIARKWFGATSDWMWASLVGMGTPFVLADVVGVSWSGDRSGEILILYLHVALGGLLVGLWQRRILQPHTARAAWWVAACSAGWMFAAAVVTLFVGGHPQSPVELLRNVGGIALGGVALGVMTGAALVWLLRSRQVGGLTETLKL